jgi:hypothetical protein
VRTRRRDAVVEGAVRAKGLTSDGRQALLTSIEPAY